MTQRKIIVKTYSGSSQNTQAIIREKKNVPLVRNKDCK